MISASADALRADYAACRDVTRARARNFYYGLRLTPEPRRGALFAVYAWMRLGDDLADAPTPIELRARSLAAFRERTERILEGETAAASEGPAPADWPAWSEAMWRAFAHALEAHSVSHADIRAMLSGLEEDLRHAGYNTFAQLEQYCARVASSVGRVCVTIWKVRPEADREASLALAHTRGLAFQMTNILRDFAQDLAAGRVYLPRALFEKHRLEPADLRAWREPARCAALVQETAARARGHYKASAALDAMIDPECAPTLWAMTRIYSTLLARIERCPRLVAGQPRARVHSLRKAGIAIRAVVRARRAAT